METYTKISSNLLKISTSTEVEGATLINDRVETREYILKSKAETEEALAIHDARRPEFTNRIELLNEKLNILGPIEPVDDEVSPQPEKENL